MGLAQQELELSTGAALASWRVKCSSRGPWSYELADVYDALKPSLPLGMPIPRPELRAGKSSQACTGYSYWEIVATAIGKE